MEISQRRMDLNQYRLHLSQCRRKICQNRREIYSLPEKVRREYKRKRTKSFEVLSELATYTAWLEGGMIHLE
jgi:hypothetical protein